MDYHKTKEEEPGMPNVCGDFWLAPWCKSSAGRWGMLGKVFLGDWKDWVKAQWQRMLSTGALQSASKLSSNGTIPLS